LFVPPLVIVKLLVSVHVVVVACDWPLSVTAPSAGSAGGVVKASVVAQALVASASVTSATVNAIAPVLSPGRVRILAQPDIRQTVS
jgi:hypothetical protein